MTRPIPIVPIINQLPVMKLKIDERISIPDVKIEDIESQPVAAKNIIFTPLQF